MAPDSIMLITGEEAEEPSEVIIEVTGVVGGLIIVLTGSTRLEQRVMKITTTYQPTIPTKIQRGNSDDSINITRSSNQAGVIQPEGKLIIFQKTQTTLPQTQEH